MKKAGKISFLAACLALMLVLFTACGGGLAPEELAGTWKMTGGEAMGQTITMEELKAQGVDVQMTLNFKDDKNVEIEVVNGGVSQKDTVAYTFENGTVTVSQQGATLIFELENDTLRVDAGGATLILER